MQVMDEEQIPHPTIINEAGAQTVAYHSVLLFNILDTASIAKNEDLPSVPTSVHIRCVTCVNWHRCQ